MWTDERIELLQRLWGQGFSASQIANQLQGVTRNAVIGKLHRLGKRERATTVRVRSSAGAAARRQAPPQTRRTERREGVLEWTARPRRLFALEEPGLATCVTLAAHMCRWPIGDPDESGFTFCGRPSDGERPYCQGHARLAYKGSTGTVGDMARLLARYL
jgi:GcrA cell cycle regulator